MQPQQPNDPQHDVRLSDEEIRAMSASLRSTPRVSRTQRTLSGVAKGLLGTVKLPLTIVLGVLVFILTGSIEDFSLLGRLGAAVLTMALVWFLLGRVRWQLGRRRFRVN